MKLLDTDFLIDLQREWTTGKPAVAHAFLRGLTSEPLVISVVSALEFLEGHADSEAGDNFLRPFRQLPITRRVARVGTRISRQLRSSGTLIGDFDVLIAATALSAGAELVTANDQHFRRVSGLRLNRYR